jgi:mannose-6-phosphate isomerase-like protein (cupin superfamily)
MGVVRAGDISEFELMGNHMRGLATPSRGAAEVAVWRGVTEAGASTPPHTHDHEEVIVVLAGSGSASMDGDQVDISPGDVVIVPARTLHQLFGPAAGEPLDAIASMPLGTRTFLPDGEELQAPWAD